MHLKLNADNDVFISGKNAGTMDFDPGAGTTTASGGFIAKYSNTLAFGFRTAIEDNFNNGLAILPNGRIVAASNSGLASVVRIIRNGADIEAPTVTTYNPTDNATSVSVTANLVMTFSENMTATTSKVVSIRRSSDNSVFESYTLPSGNVTVSGASVTINPTGSFNNNTGYYVHVEAGAFQDQSGNAFAGITNATTWNFTTVPSDDVTAPTVTSRTPAHFATGVSISANLVMNFSENVFAANGKNIFIINYDGFTVHEQFVLPSARVTVSGSTVTIDPTNNLTPLANYYVYIDNGAFQDAAGNNFAGYASNGWWDFWTADAPDLTAPTVLTYNPAAGTQNVPLDANLALIFSENVSAVNGRIVTIRRSSNNSIFETYTLPNASVGIGSNGMSINPFSNFENNTTYHVTIESGAVQDAAGNPFAGITNSTTWYFTTVAAPSDVTPPTIVSISPADNATNVAINTPLVLTFSEPIQTNNGTLSVRRLSDNSLHSSYNIQSDMISGAVLTVNLAGNLAYNTEYYIDIQAGAVRDLAGNDYAGLNGDPNWTFSTEAANFNPISFTPAHNTTDVDKGTNLTITFGENVGIGAGNISVKKVSDNSTVASISGFNALYITIDGPSVSFNFPNDLPEGELLYVEVTDEYLRKSANAAQTWGGIQNNTTWRFTTTAAPVDNTPPTIVSLSPTDNASNVAVNTQLVVTFSEPIQSNGGLISVRKVSDNSLHSSYTVNSSMISGQVLTVTLLGDLQFNTEYYVDLGVNMVTDIAGNTFAGQNGNPNWTFTTSVGDFFPTAYTPSQNATDVNKGTNLTLTFAENVGIGAGTISVRRVNDGSLVASLSNYNGAYMTLDGPNITFNFENDLPENELLYVTITDGYLRKSSNAAHTWGGIQDNTTWRFTTAPPADIQAPQIVGVSPGNGSTNVDINTTVTISFNEPLVIPQNGAGKNIVFRATDSSWAQSYSLTGPKASVSGNSVTIVDPEFPFGKTLRFELYAGVLSDASGNWISDIISTGFWTITTIAPPDDIPPFVDSVVPINNATNVTVSDNMVVTFSENISAVGGKTVSIRRAADNSAYASYTLPHANVTISGTLMTINPTNNLEYSTGYYVIIDAGAVQDAAGNIFAGIADNATWSFETVAAPDTQAPTVVSVSPTHNSTNVPVNTQFVVTFSENVVVNPMGMINIRRADNTIFSTIMLPDARANVNANVLTMTLTEPLEYGTSYYIDLGVGSLRDEAGNNFGGLSGATQWSFSTPAPPDTQAPVVVAVSPAHNSTDVAVISDLVATFSENVVISVDGTINVRRADNSVFATLILPDPQVAVSGNQMTINLTSDLEYNTTYSVDMGLNSVKDAAGNFFDGLSGATAWTFTTENEPIIDNQAPQIVSISPANGSTNVSTNQTITITFDEDLIIPVNGATKTITLRSTDNLFAQSYPFGGGNSSVSGTNLSIENPGLPEGKTIYFMLGDGTLSDVAGNWIPFMNSTSFWSIQTQPAPKQNQTITFNELTAKTFGNAAFDLSASASSGLPVSFEVVSGPATVSGTQVTLTGAGLVTIRANQAGNDAFNAASSVERSFNVNKAQLTVTADNKSMTYGEAVPMLTLQYAGFVNSQTAAVLTTAPTASTTATSASNAGQYAITVAGGTAANYDFTYVNGTLTINKADQEITVEPISDKLTSSAPFNVIASVNSGLSLTYSVSGPASISGNTLTLSGSAGTVTVLVSQTGSTNYLPTEASVSFTSVDPRTISGVAQVGSAALTSGMARLHPRNEAGVFETSTDIALGQDGSFSFTNLWPGDYALSITSTDNQVLTTYYNGKLSLAEATILNVTTSDASGLTVTMMESPAATQGPGSVSGTLVTNNNGSRSIVTSGRTTNGTPLAGVTIYLVTSPDNMPVASTVTAADGTFAFTNLPLGTYKLVIDYEGSASVTSPEIVITAQTTTFEVESEVTEEGIVITATPVTPTSTKPDFSISTYPNPSSGAFTLQWNGQHADVRGVTIYNLQGVAIWKGDMTTDRLTIDISQEPAGIYFLHFITGGDSTVHKLMVR
jgi:methionine-rich copper-binding protein CopC